MNFENYYNLNEVTSLRKNASYRFLAHSNDSKDWDSKITSIVEVASISKIDRNLLFPISDPTGNFIINLFCTNEHNFEYEIREESVQWLQEHNLTNKEEAPGFYYNLEEKCFVIYNKIKNIEHVLENKFKIDELENFLNELFFMNKLCKNNQEFNFALIYSLYFYDDLTVKEAETLRNSSMAPRWFISSLRRDETRRSGGFFSNIFRN